MHLVDLLLVFTCLTSCDVPYINDEGRHKCNLVHCESLANSFLMCAKVNQICIASKLDNMDNFVCMEKMIDNG